MKKEILLSALLIATLAACTGKGPARKFKETAERLNQTYPIRLNETITIDSTHYNEKDNTVSYYYTVTGELDDPQFMDNNYATYKKALQEAIDNSVEMEEYRKFGSKTNIFITREAIRKNWRNSFSKWFRHCHPTRTNA